MFIFVTESGSNRANDAAATHAVVVFDSDSSVSLIPRSRLLCRDGQTCIVKWPCGKLTGKIVFEGKTGYSSTVVY